MVMNMGCGGNGIVLTKKYKKMVCFAFISQICVENDNKSLSLGHNCVINTEDVNRINWF